MTGITPQLIAKDIDTLNQIIKNDLSSNIILIRQISEYIIASGGKRIRPVLTILCGKIAGYNDGTLLHKMAAMIEYIHTATLLHDDVVDESRMRRGRQTSNAIFGNAASVLVGDFIYTRSFQMMVESNSMQILKVMADSTNKISEGEVLQLLNIGNSNLTEEEYFSVIDSKTAVLFEAAAKIASIVANALPKIENSLTDYAKSLGIAFQIKDDILDYSGNPEAMGKNIGDDLLEGKVTLPLICSIQHSNHRNKLILQNAINEPQKADIKQVIDIITTSGAIPYCLKIAKDHINKAISSLQIFPTSEYKTALENLAKSAVERIY